MEHAHVFRIGDRVLVDGREHCVVTNTSVYVAKRGWRNGGREIGVSVKPVDGSRRARVVALHRVEREEKI